MGAVAAFAGAPANATVTTTPLGTTPASFSVDPTGAATYTIPLIVAPGTNGMQPSLALTYGSQSGNGPLGIGWSLAGLSVIHRCGATIEIDGFKGGVNYDANDRFCLDGERLIPNGNEFRTHRESLQRITYTGSAIDPSAFTVYDRDGGRREYGTSANARIEAQGKTAARVWALNRIIDVNGNTLDIGYEEDSANGDYRPIRIDYGGNPGAGTSHDNAVIFDYELRTDVSRLYLGGSLIQDTKRLHAITTLTGGTVVRSYHLAYDSGSGRRSRLTSIIECGTDGVCLPATTFTWQNGTDWTNGAASAFQFWTNPTNFAGAVNDYEHHFADINGDGRADWIQVSRNTDDCWVAIANDDGSFNYWTKHYAQCPRASGSEHQFVDVNGDGRSDWIEVSRSSNEGGVALASPDGSFSMNPWTNYSTSRGAVNNYEHHFADVNGDGLPDWIQIARGSNNCWIGLNGGDGNFTYWNYPYTACGATNNYEHEFVDVNGDGRADWIQISRDTNQGWIALAQPNGSFNFWDFNSLPVGAISAHEHHFADVNGDGLPDWIQIARNTNDCWIGLARGDGSFHYWDYHYTCGSVSGFEHQFIDMNGDGRADWIQISRNTNEAWIALAQPDGSFHVWDFHTVYAGAINAHEHHFTDVNGDGLPDWIQIARHSNDGWVGLAGGPFPDLLTGITNGLGAATTVAYQPLTADGVYTKDTDPAYVAHYPYIDLQTPQYVVASASASNGLGQGMNTTAYHYGGLKFHFKAARSLGFRWVQMLDPAGLTHVTYYNQDRGVDGAGGIDGTIALAQTLSPGGVALKTTTNTWIRGDYVCGGKSQPQLSSTDEVTRNPNNSVITHTTTTNAYDGCGFPASVTVDSNDGWVKTVVNTYQNDTTNGILGRLTQAQVTAYAPGQNPQTRTSQFTYRTDGLLQSEIIEPGNAALSVTTTYGYDAFGNRTSKTVSGSGIATRSDTQTFGTRGRFATTKTNAKGHTAVYAYDFRNGQATQQTDPNGLLTTDEYDGFGRKGREVHPNGIPSLITYAAVPGGGYSVLTHTDGSGDVQTFYDILGREIKVGTQGFGGGAPGDHWIYRSIQYDALGRVAFKSLPAFDAPSANGTAYQYDLLGRVTSVDPAGPNNTTTTSYTGLTVTMTNPLGQPTTTVTNSQGKPTQVTEANGTTTSYVYDPYANPITVTDALGNVTTLGYDARGRKTAMHDPDMGNWSYSYNVLGELTSQTDAKGQTTTMAYDVLGRMTSRIAPAPEPSSTWTYDSAAYGKGKLASVTDTQDYLETYAYNSLSLLTQTTTRIAGTDYPVSRTYDQFSRLATIAYPSGYTVLQTYDPHGYLWIVKRLESNGTQTLLWMASATDAFNHVTGETYGNNVASTRTYNPATVDLLAIQTGSGGGTTNLQNLSLTYDAVHNVKTRNDAITGLNESFTYDNLNRLTQATGAVTKTYQYNAIGNITYKSDSGTYTYPGSGANSVHPHAVSAVAGSLNATYSYDANGNMQSGAGRTLAWTSFNKPSSVTGANGTTTYTYGPNHERIAKATATDTIAYLGKLFERKTTGTLIEDKHYLYAGASLIAIYTSRNNGTSDTRYVHTDHLGSINLLTDENGNVTERLSFDPHGRRRLTNGQDTTTLTSTVNRGYTGHEMDDEIGLINMNARLYDPRLGRFISPDTMAEGIAGQGLNRYSYVRNNPLSLTDPTGYWSLRRALKRLVRHVSTISHIGGLLSTGLLSNPIFAPHYGLATGDWRSVGRATATAAVLAAATWAGGLAVAEYHGTLLSGIGFIGSSASIGYTSGYSIARIYGASSADARRAGIGGAKAAAIAAMLRVGWEGMKESVNEGARASGNKSVCIAGPCTAGSRTTGYDANGNPKPIPSATGFASQGMGAETLADIGHPELRAPHSWDLIPGAQEFVELVSKTHDFGNSFTYLNGFYQPSASGLVNDIFNVYSMSTMLPAAAYTGYTFGGLYFDLNGEIRER